MYFKLIINKHWLINMLYMYLMKYFILYHVLVMNVGKIHVHVYVLNKYYAIINSAFGIEIN